MKIIYIAGKVTGQDIKECKEKFSKAEYLLRRKGYQTVNPLRLCPPNSNWKDAMRACIKNLVDCDEIYMLRDWQESKGAKEEHRVAQVIGLKINYQEESYVA
jgi:hypothetical protein